MYDYQRDGLDTAIYSLNYYYQSIWQDQLDYYDILVNGSVYTQDIVSYDGQGNPTEIDNFVYTTIGGTESVYDHAILTWEARTLTSITVYNESDVVQAEISYNYNANGYRTSKTITEGTSSKQFTYELIDSLVISEKIVKIVNSVQTTQTIFYYYDTDGTLIGFNLNLEDYFYINNIQGDITGIVDTEGNVIVKYDYDSYRNIISCDPDSGFEYVSGANAYTYRGYRYDSEIRMYYLNSRYYNPDTGRFISSDGIIIGSFVSTNLYAYCNNNPIMLRDNSGYYGSWNRTYNMVESEGSDVYRTRRYSIWEMYYFYLNSDCWILKKPDTYNDSKREDGNTFLLMTTLAVAGLATGGIAITIGGISVSAGFLISAAALGGSAVIYFDSANQLDTDWMAHTFYNVNDPTVEVTYFIEYYNYDGTDIYFSILSYRPWGLKQDDLG